MRFGCAVPASAASTARSLGFDFVELRVAELFPLEPEAKFRATARLIDQAGIPAETFAFLLPPDLKVVGPTVDRDRVSRWVADALFRAQSLGGHVVVVGSDDSRRIPQGFPAPQALEQFRVFLEGACEAAAKRGIVLALEALNRTETNLLNTLADATGLADRIGRPALGVVADVYHLRMEDEPNSHLLDAAPHLVHVQLADAGRLPPGQGTFDFRTVFTFLNAAGYEGTVALECSFNHFRTEGGPTLAFVREAATSRGQLAFGE